MATVWVSKHRFTVDLSVRPNAHMGGGRGYLSSGHLLVELDVATEYPPAAGGIAINCTDAERASWVAAGTRYLEALDKVDEKFQHAHGNNYCACNWFRRMLVLLIWLPLARLPTKYIVSAIATGLCEFRINGLEHRYRPIATELRKQADKAYGIRRRRRD